MNPGVRPHRHLVLIAKSTKKQFVPTNSRVITNTLASNCTPIAPSLFISSGHKPRSGVTSNHLGGHGPEMPPWRRVCNSAPFEEALRRWRDIGNTVSDLTSPRLKLQTSSSREERVSARPTSRFCKFLSNKFKHTVFEPKHHCNFTADQEE